jgi:auxin efflux carrier family
MITGSAVYQVLVAMAPLYTAAALGYASVRWLGAFSDEQCAGINHFVALYAVPVLIFHMVSTNDLYAMDGARALWARWRRLRYDGINKAAPAAPLQLEWVVTAFSVATLPNTIIMGVPLLNGMYGEVSTTLMKPIIVMQFCFWYNVIIFLYEYMEAMRTATAKEIIVPTSPEKGNDLEQSQQVVAMTILITDVAVAFPAQVLHTNLTPVVKDKDTFGDVDKAPSVKHVFWMAVKKILRIPNTYASILGLIWSLIAFKYVPFLSYCSTQTWIAFSED